MTASKIEFFNVASSDHQIVLEAKKTSSSGTTCSPLSLTWKNSVVFASSDELILLWILRFLFDLISRLWGYPICRGAVF